MEIQESVLRNIHMIIGWQPSPRYADVRGALTEELLKVVGADGEWHWDGPMTLVIGEESGIDLAVSPSELVLASESPNIDLGELPAQVAGLVIQALAIQKVMLVGAGAVWLAPVSAKDELNEWLGGQLGSLGKPGLYDAFGGKPEAFSLEAEIRDESFSFDVEVKPVTAAEAAESDDFRSDEEEDFPPAALYLEVIRSELSEATTAEAPTAFTANLTKVVEASKKFDSAIREGL